MERDAQFKSFITYPSRIPIVALFPEPSLKHLSESPLNDPPAQFPSRAPMARDAHFQSLLQHISWSPNEQSLIKQSLTFLTKTPVKEPPSLWFPNRDPMERCSVSRPSSLFIHSYLSD